MTMKTRATRLLLVAGAIVAFGAGISYAAIPGTDAVINGCYEKRTGLLRVIDAEAGKKCTQWETPITWSQQYVAGEGLTLTGNVFSVADGSLKAADFSTVDEEGLTSDNIKNESLSGTDLENGTVTEGDVQDASLTGTDLQNGTVAAADVTNESLTGTDLENDSVATNDIADESLTGTDLDDGSVATGDIANESLSGTDIRDNSLSGDELAGGSVATAALRANAANADLSFPLQLNDNSPETVASATVTIPTAGSPPAGHRLLVIGQALVEGQCFQCTADGRVEWALYDGAGPNATRLLPSPGQPPYEARFSDTFITSVSHVLTAPAGERTIALRLERRGPGPGPNFSMSVTHASLSVVDLGSV
jgi:uncharacterized protein YjbI with pentapeptide repeats